ncbi:MAG: GNAT family N-acetyltransferase [Myxococcota bacterium]
MNTVEAAANDLVLRFATRDPWTQSLSFTAGLQDRGWACLLAGGAVVAVQSRRDGPHARMQRPQVIDVPQIDAICGRLPLRSFSVEPGLRGVIVDRDGDRHRWNYDAQAPSFGPLVDLGWRPLRRHQAHTKTRVVDLRPGLDEVVRSFASVARRNVRAAQRADIEYRDCSFAAVTDLELSGLRDLNREFLAAHPGLSNEWALRLSVTRHLGERGRYILAESGRRIVGAIYLVLHDRVATYFVAQASAEFKAQRVATGLVCAAMRVAIEHGCDLFDFSGVHDERFPDRLASWKGFTTFKERYGGEDVYLPPGFDVPLPESQ